jgi:hypothetical protein
MLVNVLWLMSAERPMPLVAEENPEAKPQSANSAQSIVNRNTHAFETALTSVSRLVKEIVLDVWCLRARDAGFKGSGVNDAQQFIQTMESRLH